MLKRIKAPQADGSGSEKRTSDGPEVIRGPASSERAEAGHDDESQGQEDDLRTHPHTQAHAPLGCQKRNSLRCTGQRSGGRTSKQVLV